jgi:hypothetical protein
MGLNWPKSGPNHVPSYQISGLPYVTQSAAGEAGGTVIKHTFPFVTRYFQIGNQSANKLRVGFTENGVKGTVTNNYFIVEAGIEAANAPRIEIRCKELYFLQNTGGNAASFEILAGLTSIPHDQMPILTGSQDPTKPVGIVYTGVG